MPLDAARDGLIALQAQLAVVLAVQNAALAEQVAQLRAANAELAERLARLERAVSRNSGNSSMPPSADDLPGRTPPPQRRQPRPQAKKRPGKQPGAPGAYLAWSESPQRTVPLFPQGACGCGRDLAAAADLGVTASHQVIDVPLVTAAVTQYDEHAVECACGWLHAAAPPPVAGAAGTVTYWLNIQAWCVFLVVAHHVPAERCAEVIASLTGTRPSDGFVHAMLARRAGHAPTHDRRPAGIARTRDPGSQRWDLGAGTRTNGHQHHPELWTAYQPTEPRNLPTPRK